MNFLLTVLYFILFLTAISCKDKVLDDIKCDENGCTIYEELS